MSSASSLQLGLLEAPLEQGTWPVRTSLKARRLSVRVFPGGRVDIVVPMGTRPATVERFVAHHRSWIERKVSEFRALAGLAGDALPEEIVFNASGRRIAVSCEAGLGPARLRHDDTTLLVTGDLTRTTHVRHLLQRWVLREAHRLLVPWLEREATRSGLTYQRAQIRRQRTRWGSCSRRGTISLNACLLFQPAEVVRYLLIHELAHTQHMDHSRRFWDLVASHEPDWRQLDRQLAGGWREVPGWVLG